MKFLLTSSGISNKTIEKAFFELTQKQADKIKAVFIPTAANIEPGDKWWLVNDLVKIKDMGFAQLDIVDISAVPQNIWRPRLEEADVLFVGGGNTFHLMFWIKKSGLGAILPDLLKTRLWVGTSAGSMVPGIGIINDEDRVFAEKIEGEEIGIKGLGYVPFSLKPHYLSSLFEGRDDENVEREAKQFKEAFYAIDDNTAIMVDGDKLEVISEGKWRSFNQD
jgi:dipeptidase E